MKMIMILLSMLMLLSVGVMATEDIPESAESSTTVNLSPKILTMIQKAIVYEIFLPGTDIYSFSDGYWILVFHILDVKPIVFILDSSGDIVYDRDTWYKYLIEERN